MNGLILIIYLSSTQDCVQSGPSRVRQPARRGSLAEGVLGGSKLEGQRDQLLSRPPGGCANLGAPRRHARCAPAQTGTL